MKGSACKRLSRSVQL